jgi:hypothetical protein
MFAPGLFVLGTLEPLKLAPDMFVPTFYYLSIASTPANFHPSITSVPIYPMMWPTRGYEVAANMDKVSHIYYGQSVNNRLTHIGRERRSYGQGGQAGGPGGRAHTQP